MKLICSFILFISSLLSLLQTNTDKTYLISKKDVKLFLPKEFPKPIYTFKNNPVTPDGFILGRKLFYDEILSRDTTVSCHTCHQRIAAFAHIDHRLSHGIDAKIGSRNVPAIQNLIWKNSFMWDGGINHIEVQAIHPITSDIEMDETLENVIYKLRQDSSYRRLFKNAFRDTVINTQRMLRALTQFMGMMISSNSKYDQYLRGEDTFSLQEKNGLFIFRKKCANCHQEPLFTDHSFRNNGIKPDSLLNDVGRAKISLQNSDNYKFAVPSLRNVEMTYPYMHDGRFRKLYDVLKHYGNPNSHSLLKDSNIQKIGYLSDNEKVDILAFLLTLTDRTFLNDKRFADPNFKY